MLKQFGVIVDKLRTQSKPDQKIQTLYTYLLKLSLLDRNTLLFLMDKNARVKKQIRLSDKLLLKVLRPDLQLSDNAEVQMYLTVDLTGADDLSITETKALFEELSLITGRDSILLKQKLILKTVKKVMLPVAKIILELLLNRLRCGVSLQMLLKTIAKIDKVDVKQLYKTHATTRLVANVTTDVISERVIRPMLCKPYNERLFLKTLKYSDYVFEYKYDGFRVIVYHCEGVTSAHTRNLLFLTNLTPFLKRALQLTEMSPELILDMQLIGDSNFQELSKVIMRKNIPESLLQKLSIKIFDILSYQKKDLILETYATRKQILLGWLTRQNLVNYYVPYHPITKPIVQHITESVNYEGLILKSKFAAYAPNKRTNDWIKLKPQFYTVDLLVTRVHEGRGSKEGYYAAVTVATTTESGALVEIGEVGSGFKLEDLKFLKEQTDNNKKILLEVKYQGLQSTQKYSSGYSLRFPVFLRFRVDKDDITPLTEILNNK